MNNAKHTLTKLLGDSLRRDDMTPAISATVKVRKARKMWAVLSEGKDHGAYPTKAEAEKVAHTLPDGYVSQCTR